MAKPIRTKHTRGIFRALRRALTMLTVSGLLIAPLPANPVAGKAEISASAPGTAPASKIKNVEALYTDGGVTVRIHTGRKIPFEHQIVPAKNGKPFRIILDCQDADHALGGNRFASLPRSVVTRIRTSQYAVTPRHVTRIVLDLSKESFYRVLQEDTYIDIFVTDHTAKRFNNWSSAEWLASQMNAKLDVKSTKQSGPAKPAKTSLSQSSDSKSPAVASATPAPKTPAPDRPVIKSPKTSTSDKAEADKISLASLAKAKVAKMGASESVSDNSDKPVKIASKSVNSPKLPSSAPMKATKPRTSFEPVTVASGVNKKASTAKNSEKKSSSSDVKKKVIAKKAKPAATVSTVTPVTPVTTSNSSQLANSKSETQTVKAEKAAKKSSKNTLKKTTLKSAATTKPAPTLAAKTEASANKSSNKSSTKTVGNAGTKKSKKASSNAHKSSAKSVKAVASLAAKDETAKKVAAKKAATKATKKSASKTTDKKSPVKAAKSQKSDATNRSLFASTANAASKPPVSKSSTEAEKAYSAKFRSALADRRAVKLKGTQVAEFPKRLTIKYKAKSSRDPFESLFREEKQEDGPFTNVPPNVEALTMVGVLRDVNAKTRGLFEDIDGRGYILAKGDKVKNGTVLKVTETKAYFQIFEYGWSRTVALSLDGR